MTSEQALLFLVEQLLAVDGDLEQRLTEGRPVEYGLVYQICSCCRAEDDADEVSILSIA